MALPSFFNDVQSLQGKSFVIKVDPAHLAESGDGGSGSGGEAKGESKEAGAGACSGPVRSVIIWICWVVGQCPQEFFLARALAHPRLETAARASAAAAAAAAEMTSTMTQTRRTSHPASALASCRAM